VNRNHIGMMEQVVCANAHTFIGTAKSTFTGYITRMRGGLRLLLLLLKRHCNLSRQFGILQWRLCRPYAFFLLMVIDETATICVTCCSVLLHCVCRILPRWPLRPHLLHPERRHVSAAPAARTEGTLLGARV
jgi:hypothetical protein